MRPYPFRPVIEEPDRSITRQIHLQRQSIAGVHRGRNAQQAELHKRHICRQWIDINGGDLKLCRGIQSGLQHYLCKRNDHAPCPACRLLQTDKGARFQLRQ